MYDNYVHPPPALLRTKPIQVSCTQTLKHTPAHTPHTPLHTPQAQPTYLLRALTSDYLQKSYPFLDTKSDASQNLWQETEVSILKKVI